MSQTPVIDPSPSTAAETSTPSDMQRSMFQPQKKKRNSAPANHLLQFTLPPRQPATSSTISGNSSRKSSKATTAAQHAFRKQRFVHANFRFVVSSKYPALASHVFDPDAIVPWEYIEQIVVTSEKSEYSCPICLADVLVAPQITQCGHVFCHSCILHYLTLGEKEWRKCPICHERLHSKDLTSVCFNHVYDYAGRLKESGRSKSAEDLFMQEAMGTTPSKHRDYVVMKLMQRSSGSTTILPRLNFSKWAMSSLPVVDSKNYQALLPFSKFMVADSQFVLDQIVGPELFALKGSLKEAKRLGDIEECSFLEMAIDRTKSRSQKLSSRNLEKTDSPHESKRLLSPSFSVKETQLSSALEFPFLPPPLLDNSKLPTAQDNFEAGSFGSLGAESLSSVSDSSPVMLPRDEQTSPVIKGFNLPGKSKAEASPSLDNGLFYFYQAADGQHLYLHPLEIKILKTEYKEYDNFPDEICAKVSEIAESTLNEEFRKRYRYLSHLPLFCDVSFVEIDWKDSGNICRRHKDPLTPLYLSGSPSEFRANYNNNDSFSGEYSKLVSGSSIAEWKHEIDARNGKREKKKKAEDKEDARRKKNISKNSTSTVELEALAAAAASGLLSRSPRSSSNMMFDFDDETSWVPLGSSAASLKKSPALSAVEASAVVVPVMSSSFPPPSYQSSFPSYANKVKVESGVILDASVPQTVDLQHDFPALEQRTAAHTFVATPVSFAAALSSKHAALNATASGGDSSQEKKKGKKKQVVVLMSTSGSRTGGL